MLTAAQVSKYGLLPMIAMDMYQSTPTSLAPPPDIRLAAEWKLLGYLTATDFLFVPQRAMLKLNNTVCYGYLAQSIVDPSVFVVAIRGTNGILEWVDDARFDCVAHPVAGKVEAGFWGIYESMQYRSLEGDVSSVAAGIAKVVGTGTVTVIGHSLGSALCTYLTFDLADAKMLADRVSAVILASPRTGNTAFVQAFDARVKEYDLWNYELDVVPRVPRGDNYADLPRLNWITMAVAQASVRFSLLCHHHNVCYCSMLNYGLCDWKKLSNALDASYAACIRGPTGT